MRKYVAVNIRIIHVDKEYFPDIISYQYQLHPKRQLVLSQTDISPAAQVGRISSGAKSDKFRTHLQPRIFSTEAWVFTPYFSVNFGRTEAFGGCKMKNIRGRTTYILTASAFALTVSNGVAVYCLAMLL
jgi:hypothetical protein